MRRHRPLPPELAHAPFTARTALASGVSPKRLRGSDLHAPFHGVRVASVPTNLDGLCRAYAARMPAHAFFCGITASRLMGAPLPRHLEAARTLHVAVPSPRRSPSGAGIVGRSVTVRSGDVRVRDGLRMSSPERAWCELAAVLELKDLVAVGDFFIHHRRPLTRIARLDDAVTRYSGRRGLPRLREALPLLDERAESRKETHLRLILLGGNIPDVVTNLCIVTSGGYEYRADLAVPARKAVIEYQSDYHGDMVQFRKDMTRRGRLEADGWVMILVNADDLRDPAELVMRLRAQLASRPLSAASLAPNGPHTGTTRALWRK